MPKFIDLTGQRFGRWTVIERGTDHFTKSGARLTTWKCVCDCGAHKEIAMQSLRKGTSVSCGCYGKENKSKLLAERNRKNAKHGRSKERLHAVWNGMINRCYNPKNSCFKMYGGRGITVCEEWKNDYMSFREWAIANGYDESVGFGKCTLDRIDNSRGYSSSNCRWASAEEQANNRRSNLMIAAFGKKQNLLAWAKETGIKYGTLRGRIVKSKWDVERALTEPVKGVVRL